MGREKNRMGLIWNYMRGGIGDFEEAANFADRAIEKIKEKAKEEALREFKKRYRGGATV